MKIALFFSATTMQNVVASTRISAGWILDQNDELITQQHPKHAPKIQLTIVAWKKLKFLNTFISKTKQWLINRASKDPPLSRLLLQNSDKFDKLRVCCECSEYSMSVMREYMNQRNDCFIKWKQQNIVYYYYYYIPKDRKRVLCFKNGCAKYEKQQLLLRELCEESKWNRIITGKQL